MDFRKSLIRREEQLYIEIEDTGSGIEAADRLYQMQHDMQNADIEMLKEQAKAWECSMHACGLKCTQKDHVCFEIEGEEGVGTWITICIPMEYLSFAEGCVNGRCAKGGKKYVKGFACR